MVFPFTFTSMLPYPFSSAAPVEPQPEEVQSPWLLLNMPEQPEYALAAGSTQASPTKRRLPKAPQRVFDHDDREPVPLQRKRGWEPAAPSTVVEPATTSRSVAGRVRFDLQSPFPENSRAGYGMNEHASALRQP
ncbi:hypothetical protein DL93DRAFT_2166697 [Clavulina sp. PMI_390]|nr:hypothetical protein DL93DRAFT_2166697 [Clavulina sp. PMI_390]